MGVNTDDRREVLGVATGPSEAEPFWKTFLHSLADLVHNFQRLAWLEGRVAPA